MPFNNGTFIKIATNKDTMLTAEGLNIITEDIAGGLSQTFLRDGSVALTGNLKADSHKLTGLANGTADTDAATIGQLNTVQGNAVLLTGDQTVAGTKTFTSSPVVPTPSANDSSTKVATTAWVNTVGNNVVHKTGDETIGGTKTFTGDLYVKDNIPAVWLQENDTIKGTNPQTEQIWSIYNQDSSSNLGNSHRLGIFTTHLRTDGTTITWMGAYKNEADSESAATIRVFYPQTGDPYTYAPQPTDTNSTGSYQIATVGWVNNQNIATNIVHKNGDENIAGLKNFTWGAVHISSSGIIKGTTPSEIKYLSYSFNDKNGTSYSANALGTVTLSYDTNGTIRTSLVALKPQANSTASAGIYVCYPKTGNPYTSAPTPTDTTSTSSTQIATVGWVNNAGNNLVHLTGTESITGSKTFISNPYISNGEPRLFLRNRDITRGTAPSTKEITAINFQDTNGDWYAYVQGIYDTDKSTKVIIGAKKSINSSDSDSVSMSIGYNSSGNPYTFAPTPTDTTSTSGTQIATTGWVNTTGNNLVHIDSTENITGTKTFKQDVNVNTDSPAIYLRENDTVKGTNPQNEQVWAIYNQDSANSNAETSRLGVFTTHLQTNGTVWSAMSAYKNSANLSTNASIRVYYPVSGSPYATSPIPTDTISTSSTQIATVGWVNTIGNNVVHLTGTERITGSKTFTSKLSTASIKLYPHGSETQPHIDFHFNSNSNDYTSRIIENSSGELRVLSTFFIVPTPNQTTSTSSVQAATVGWVNTTGNNLVHLTDTEEITGQKTFTQEVILKDAGYDYKGYLVKNINITKGTAPATTNAGAQFVFQDSTGNGAPSRIGGVETIYGTNGTIETRLQAFKPQASSETLAQIKVTYPATGDPYTSAPASDVNGSIVTTVNKSKSQNGYFKLGNGLIVQWGNDSSTTVGRTISFPTAFSGTNYGVSIVSIISGVTGDYTNAIQDKTSTGFKANTNKPISWVAIGY